MAATVAKSLTPAWAGETGTARSANASLVRFAWGVTGYNVLVVLWGSVVRATGSGAGCGEHWPLCNGMVVQHWQSLATAIEFAHRASSGVALVLLAVLAVWTWRATPRRHLARFFAGLSALLTFNEALLGALLVLLGLTANNHSPLRAAYLSLHLANTLLLLGSLALTAHFLARSTARMRGGVALVRVGPAALALGVTLLVGVSGSLAALGDTLYPAHSLAQAFAQDVDGGGPGAWLLRLRLLHPAASLLAAGCVLLLVRMAWPSPELRGQGKLLLALVALQLMLGAGDVLLLAPTAMQVLHLLVADLLWIALVVLAARLCVVSLGCPGGGQMCGGAAGASL
jgi:heme a synthase